MASSPAGRFASSADSFVGRGRNPVVDVTGEAQPWSAVAVVAAALTCTKAMRMLARASRIVDACLSRGGRRAVDEAGDGVDREAADCRSGVGARQVDRGQLVEPHHVVGHDDLGGYLGEAPAGLLDRLLGVPRRVDVIVGQCVIVEWIRSTRGLP